MTAHRRKEPVDLPRAAVALEPFDPRRHRDLLRAWLGEPHVSRFWGEPERALSATLRREPGTNALILVDGRPVGYVCWQRPSSMELAEAGLSDLPPGLVDIDILIGDPQQAGRGVGPRALAVLLGRLGSEGTTHAGVGTAVDNRRAIRAYEKAGFRPFREFREEGSGQCLYMVAKLGAPRPASRGRASQREA